MTSFIKKGYFTDEFSLEFKNEIHSYIEEVMTKKGSVQISGYVDEEDEYFSRLDLIALLTYYLDRLIFEWDLEYMLRFLEFNIDDNDEKINEVLFNFSDPYLGYPINDQNVEKSISFLLDKTCQLDLTEEKELRKGYRSVFLRTGEQPLN